MQNEEGGKSQLSHTLGNSIRHACFLVHKIRAFSVLPSKLLVHKPFLHSKPLHNTEMYIFQKGLTFYEEKELHPHYIILKDKVLWAIFFFKLRILWPTVLNFIP